MFTGIIDKVKEAFGSKQQTNDSSSIEVNNVQQSDESVEEPNESSVETGETEEAKTCHSEI